MSFRSLTSHKATVSHLSPALDRFGQPQPTFTPAEVVSCRLVTQAGGEQFTDRSYNVVFQHFTLYFPPEVALGESDRIEQVVDRHGHVLVRTLDVLSVKPVVGFDGTIHHFEVDAQVYRSGDVPVTSVLN